MLIRGFIEEDFVQYHKPALVLMSAHCDWKCGQGLCHNSPLAMAPAIRVEPEFIVKRYMKNDITKAIVFSGLEPLMDFEDLLLIVRDLRDATEDDIVIYTGYNEDEVEDKIEALGSFSNIYMKFGRFIPNCAPHKDETLGVWLASDNQYGRKIS